MYTAPNEYARKGHENRRKRAIKVWLSMWKLYSDPYNPLPVVEIAKKIKKINGKPYSEKYIYAAFKQLRELGLIEQ